MIGYKEKQGKQKKIYYPISLSLRRFSRISEEILLVNK